MPDFWEALFYSTAIGACEDVLPASQKLSQHAAREASRQLGAENSFEMRRNGP